jgi:hypothetical protein
VRTIRKARKFRISGPRLFSTALESPSQIMSILLAQSLFARRRRWWVWLWGYTGGSISAMRRAGLPREKEARILRNVARQVPQRGTKEAHRAPRLSPAPDRPSPHAVDAHENPPARESTSGLSFPKVWRGPGWQRRWATARCRRVTAGSLRRPFGLRGRPFAYQMRSP